MPAPSPLRDGVAHSVCPHDCADTCSILSHVENGRLTRVEGNPAHPVTRGTLCRKVMRAPARVHGGQRLLHPLLRSGPKGSGRFEPISWDQAIAIIRDRWSAILDRDGPLAILPFHGSGTEGLVQGDIVGKRFFNRLGTLQQVRTICTRAGRTGVRHVMGGSIGADPTRIADCRLLVSWGVNTAYTNIHQAPFLREARAGGAKRVMIDPLRLKGAETADLVLQPRPGTDAALALGVMHEIVRENRHDARFIRDHTHGFTAFAERLHDYPPERAAAITGVPEEHIRALARLLDENRPCFISVGPGCQRHSNGGMTLRTLACLPALVGAYRWRGGGLYFPTSTVFPVDFEPLEGNELRPTPAAGYNMIHLARLLTEPGTPTIRALYVANGNPATMLYDQSRVLAGLAREDLFTVVHELVMTDTARHADIVLPATSQFEHPDILFSYYHPSLLLNRPAVAPVGLARSNLETLSALAHAMGFVEPCFDQDAWEIIDEVLALDHPAIADITLERLLADGWAPARVDDGHDCFLNGRYPSPSGRIEFLSETLSRQGQDPLPAYVPLRESPETTPELFARYPLYLLTPSAHATLNSAYGEQGGDLPDEKTPTLLVHPEDATPRGIASGDRVRVVNDRGSSVLTARVDAAIRPGVVLSHGVWWSHAHPDGHTVNATTPDHPADMGGGSTFNTNLVQLEKMAPLP